MGVVKFVDFGASKIITKGQAKTMARTTRSRVPNAQNGDSLQHNSLTGTPMYMSPESIKPDKRGRQGAMDIWSLGCVVLECATGRKPWNSALDNEWCAYTPISHYSWTTVLTDFFQGDHVPDRVCTDCLSTVDPTNELCSPIGKATEYLSSLNRGN